MRYVPFQRFKLEDKWYGEAIFSMSEYIDAAVKQFPDYIPPFDSFRSLSWEVSVQGDMMTQVAIYSVRSAVSAVSAGSASLDFSS